MEERKNMPEKKFSAGAISATLWRNEVPNRSAGTFGYYTVNLQRGYRDRDGKWQNTSSLRVNDLPKAALVLNRAYEYLVLKETEDADAEIP
jgi:hypothetical protein